MADKKLNIKVGLKGHKKAEKGLGKLDGRMKSLGTSALKLGGTFFAAQGIIRGFSAVIRLAGEQEKAEKKLETALGKTSQALLDHASSLQKVTTFGDEAIIGVQASLAAFLDSEDAIKKATEATLDISVAMGMDLKAAGDLVAKTLGSSTNAMSRYGIQVEGAVGSTERLESLTGNVAKLFGGQAKAQAETMAGSLEQMKNAVGDAAEALGSLLAPVVITVANGIRIIAEGVGSIVKEFDTLTTKVELAKIFTESELKVEDFKKSIEGLSHEQLIDLRDNMEQSTNQFILLNTESNNLASTMLDIVSHAIIQTANSFDTYSEKVENATEKTGSLLDGLKKVPTVAVPAREYSLSFGESFLATMTLNQDSIASFGQMLGNTSQLLATMADDDKDRQLRAMRLAQAGAIANTAAQATKVLANPFALGAVLAAGGVQLLTIENAIQDAQGFAQGGIVPGQGTGDTVPAMLTPGEVILNQAQQENLVGGMGVTVNISAPLVDETVVDSIIPAIEKAQRMNLA